VADPSYDGLCGIPSLFRLADGRYLRCRYEPGHVGDHEWRRHEHQFDIVGGITVDEILRRARQGSAAAQSMAATLGIPPGCTCTPVFSSDGGATTFLFAPDCTVHDI